MKINALGAMLVLTAGTVAFAQQAAAPQLEVPYLCSGITVTIHRCGNVGGQDVCMYRVDIPGGQSVEVNKPREQVMAQLKSCKLQPGGVARTPGQPLNPAYLSEMPSVDRVMKAMQINDPRETALRQMGAFYQLSEVISTLSGPREIRGYMPDELRILTAYSKAQYDVGQAADKAFPGPYGTEKTLSGNTPYRYSRNDPRFGYKGIQVWQTLLSEGMHNQFAKIIGADNAKYEAKVAEQKRDAAAALAANSAPSAQGGAAQAGGMRNDAGSVAARRCVEAGRSEMECVGEGLKTGLNDMFGGVVGGVLGSRIPDATSGFTGLRMSGDFSAAGILILMSEQGATVKCGGLVPQGHQYTVEPAGNQMRVKIETTPKPITATFRADGKLVGSGAVEVAGRVVVGSSSVGGGTAGGYLEHTETTTQERQIPAADVANHSVDEVHQNGQEYSVSEQHTTTTYEPTAPSAPRVVLQTAAKTEHCNVGVLPGTPQKGLVAGLSEMLDPSTPKSAGKPFGVRMAGTYAETDGLSIEFRSDSATVECGEAHVAMGYKVENVSGQVQVKINNPAGPFMILLRPDGNLEGSGTVKVAGRVVIGSRGDEIVYAPRNASCAVGTLRPKGKS